MDSLSVTTKEEQGNNERSRTFLTFQMDIDQGGLKTITNFQNIFQIKINSSAKNCSDHFIHYYYQ